MRRPDALDFRVPVCPDRDLSALARSFRRLCFPVVSVSVSDVSRTKIAEVTLNALRTRQSLVKGERLVRHEMRAVLSDLKPGIRLEHHSVQRSGKQT